MEAIHIYDPGWYLLLDNGLRFYVWRRAVLKQMGKRLTDRVFPSFPPFKFNFISGDMTGPPGDRKCHATYGYFYDSWYHTVFNSDTIAFGEFLNIAFWPEPRVPGTCMPMGFQTAVDYASWWFMKRRNLLEVEAFLNACAEVGFWFKEIPYERWDKNMKVIRIYKATNIWKPAVCNDAGAVERHQIINKHMYEQGITLNSEPNIPIIPLSTVDHSSIVTRRPLHPTRRKILTLELNETFNKFFDFEAASEDITGGEGVDEEIIDEKAASEDDSAIIHLSYRNTKQRVDSHDLVDTEQERQTVDSHDLMDVDAEDSRLITSLNHPISAEKVSATSAL
jgi:hypothetical protein